MIAAKATVESARINLAYTKVTAPISGRIGKSTVTEGALVTNGQTTELATVQQLDPIYVDVTQSSNDFMRLKQSVEQGNLHKENATSNVELVMENGQTYPLKGTLQFSDVTVDESTGSITLRAVFPNPQHTLLPGMFVRARIDEGVQPDAILIPQQGVSRTPRGDATVLIVNDKSQVEARPVVASQAIGDKWLISEGLKSGDQVIVSGLQKARPGEQVKATTDTPHRYCIEVRQSDMANFFYSTTDICMGAGHYSDDGGRTGDPTIARRSVSNHCTACSFCFSKLSGR